MSEIALYRKVEDGVDGGLDRQQPSQKNQSSEPLACERELCNLLLNNQRQRRTCHALCHILYPVSAAHTSIFLMNSVCEHVDGQRLDHQFDYQIVARLPRNARLSHEYLAHQKPPPPPRTIQ